MATGATYETLRDDAYAGVATLTQLAGSTYYHESWTVLSLLMMTGLFAASELAAPRRIAVRGGRATLMA